MRETTSLFLMGVKKNDLSKKAIIARIVVGVAHIKMAKSHTEHFG